VSAPYPPSGQPQWPGQQQRRPERPPPIEFRPEDPEPPRRNDALVWALRIAGLVAIAVVSGLLWAYIRSDDTNPTTPPDDSANEQTEGRYDFTVLAQLNQPRLDSTCAEHSYGDTQEFFQETECDQLTRSVFTTSLEDGRSVYTSVVVVRMPTEQDAADLRELTDGDGTGNVKDLVNEGIVSIEGLDKLNGGGYKSTQLGAEVVIVEADFAPDVEERDDEDALDTLCEDGLRLGEVVKNDSAG
jgi:hypothetical protein